MSNNVKDIDLRNMNELSRAINDADALLNKSYLPVLSKGMISQYSEYENSSKQAKELSKNIRFLGVTQIVLNKNENIRDKLTTVFNSLGNVGASLLVLVKGSKDRVELYFGVRNDESKTYLSGEMLKKSIKANFPGSRFDEDIDIGKLETQILNAIPNDGIVASVTDVAGLRYEDETKERQFTQGIEKLIDAMQGEEYTLLLIADPIGLEGINAARRSLENLYSSLVPFSESQYTVGKNESDALNKTITNTVTNTVNESVTDTISHTVGKSTSTTNSTSISRSGTAAGAAAGTGIGAAIGTYICPGNGTLLGATIGGAIGGLVGELTYGTRSNTNSTTESENYSDTESSANTRGTSRSEGKSETSGEIHTDGSSQNIQIKFENHTVKKILERIDKTIERYDTCADLGMWNCAVYCISSSEHVSQMIASAYQSLIRGKNSSLENGVITLWNKNQSNLIIKSLKHMQHPKINMGGTFITPGTLVSSSELAIHAGIPARSVPGIPVVECAQFGRSIATFDEKNDSELLRLGKVFNMHQIEGITVDLNINNLTSHVFVTGSTGSGKSNTIYHMLSNLKAYGKNFLIVEPSKGEYKDVFGNDKDVSVYGTNASFTPLLRINPFSFPHGNENPRKNIHILEHLDRLVEIFNVCWPMYAAMPAVLKEAVERSYEDCGWDLATSKNHYENELGELYPTFADVARNIRTIIDNSEYDTENKGAYKGSLLTRLNSLTNGLNGQIFCDREISSTELFDENVIVDLSRVGSSETKSLIMGLLILKLQEYRMSSCSETNSILKHLTVLEEAHNLLKRTSSEQSSESANLTGKSVEMLANAIAEMRTYGEGFIIADQAPALLDMAVIRNTNTKIIMRLPDKDDRELVGKAANLNDDQILELSKFPRGVAAIYQNEWIEPVLCQVDRAQRLSNPYEKKSENYDISQNLLYAEQKLEIGKLLLMGVPLTTLTMKDISNLNISSRTKVQIANRIENGITAPEFMRTSPAIAEIFSNSAKALREIIAFSSDKELWNKELNASIMNEISNLNCEEKLRQYINQALITQIVLNEARREQDFNEWYKGGYLK